MGRFQPARRWCLLILGLMSMEVQPRPPALTTVVHGHSSRVPQLPESRITPDAFNHTSVALDNAARQREGGVTRGSPASDEPSPRARLSEASPYQNNLTPEREAPPSRRGPRTRRHANNIAGRSPVQLMRVGCVLGTCQVQNLSHRLYQLIGQSGRQDSSPINPRSPHSYG
ncbi:hypothetical protein NHX12_002872 [Muraenolepis orangiensis]|uniref:Adrenomedullin 2 n=1 Tax=Muraenolepis orangiensis TaxID=630683 RepID=A0A9Q0E0A0_9TELE|nr:hypothetical protein NHX12_002872 [Muraenolepis orangiensis]